MAAAGSNTVRGPNRALKKTTKQPLNMVAILSAVGIQEPSSKPKPAAPRRSGRPTLSKRAFRVARPAPRNPAILPTQGFVLICGVPDPTSLGCSAGDTGRGGAGAVSPVATAGFNEHPLLACAPLRSRRARAAGGPDPSGLPPGESS